MKLRNKIKLWLTAHWSDVVAVVGVVSLIMAVSYFVCRLIVWLLEQSSLDAKALGVLGAGILLVILVFAATEKRK